MANYDDNLSATRHVGGNEIPRAEPGKTIVHRVSLGKNETAWMPGTTKHVYRGPCTIEYTIHPDGGVDARKCGAEARPPVAAGVVCKCDEPAAFCPMHGRPPMPSAAKHKTKLETELDTLADEVRRGALTPTQYDAAHAQAIADEAARRDDLGTFN